MARQPSPHVPHDVDAESACLGSMLLSRAAVEVGVQRLIAEDFYKPGHMALFEAIVECYKSGQPVDPVSAAAAALSRGTGDLVGGAKGVLAVQATTPASANVESYIEIIVDRADRRRLIALGHEVADMATDPGATLDDLVDRVRVGAAEVHRGSGSRRFPHFGEYRTNISMQEEWIIPDILEARDRVILVAGEGAGKSFLLRIWALMAACGVHWFSEQPIRAVPTVVFDVENSPRQIRRNTEEMWRRAHEVRPGFDEQNFVIVPFAQLDITRRSDRLEIESYLVGHRPAIVVIGPLYKIMPPPTAKVSYEESAWRGISVIDDWRARFDIAVLIEHHSPKGSGGVRHLDPLGSSAWMRWPEFGLKLEEDREDPTRSFLGHFRGQRERRPWPSILERGTAGQWQWRAMHYQGPNPSLRPPPPRDAEDDDF